jgi:hypothetical protein
MSSEEYPTWTKNIEDQCRSLRPPPADLHSSWYGYFLTRRNKYLHENN